MHAPQMYKGDLHATEHLMADRAASSPQSPPDLRPYFHHPTPYSLLFHPSSLVTTDARCGDLHAPEYLITASIAKDTQIALLVIAKDIVSNVYIAKTTSFALFTAPADYYLLPARHRSRTVLV